MELNSKLDNKYKKDKMAYEKLDKLKDTLNKKKKEIVKFQRAKEDAEINKERAKEDKDKTAEQNADAAIKLATGEIEKLKEQVEKITEILKKNKEKVDSYINELNQDPEFKAHMNSILEKRYNRQIKKLANEKNQVNLIIDLCAEHPSLENNLKGMIRANEETNKLNEELAKLDPVKDKKRIDEIKNVDIPALISKKNMNEKSFMAYCEKNNVKIDPKFLQDMIKNNQFSHNKNGDIKVSKTLNNISKGYEKKIDAYEKSIGKIPGATVYESNKERIEEFEELGNEEGTNLPAKKFKWWQFGKRFNAWIEQMKAKKEEKQNYGKAEASTGKFRDAYKYDIVKDYIDKKEKDIYKESAKEVRRSNNGQER